MPRRKNPIATFVIFLVVAGFGYASYHYLMEEKILTKKEKPPPPPDQIDRLRASIESALGSSGCFMNVMSINWRPNANHFRVDINMPDGCEKTAGRQIASRVIDTVKAGTDGQETEVWCYSLGREIFHQLP